MIVAWRDEADREDLLRDATAYRERIELGVPSCGQPVFIGWRAGGGASIYFGGDPAYHFNSQFALRRAFVAGELLKAERGRLVALRRARQSDEVQLLSHTLDDEAVREFRQGVSDRLAALKSEILDGQAIVRGQVPNEPPLLDRVVAWIERLPAIVEIANVPNAT